MIFLKDQEQLLSEERLKITPLNDKERKEVKERFGDNTECSFGKNGQGYFAYTHRSRSKTYESIAKIPKAKVKQVGSTG